MVTQADLADIYTVSLFNLPGGNNITMWSSYSSSGMLQAFEAAAALGFNTIRIALRTNTSAFAFPTTPNVPPAALTAACVNLTDACNQAAAAGLRVHLMSLVDWTYPSRYGDWGLVESSQTWFTSVIGAVQASNLSFTTDLATTGVITEAYNEISFADTNTYTGGFDSGYPGSESSPTNGQVAITWAQVMIPWLRTLTGGLVTISTTNFDAPLPAGDLVAGVAGLSGSQVPDWWEWHSYPGGSVSALNSDMSAALTAVNGAPLYIGETGTPANHAGINAQKQWLQNARYVSQSLGLSEPGVWVLYDSPGTPNYGLYDYNGVARPAIYNLYQLLPPGSAVPQTGTDRWLGTSGARQRITSGIL